MYVMYIHMSITQPYCVLVVYIPYSGWRELGPAPFPVE